jgi:hypothetical protein
VFAMKYDRGGEHRKGLVTMIHDEEGAMADEACLPTTTTTTTPYSSSTFLHILHPHAITNRTTRGPLGRGHLLQARFELPLDGGYKHGTVIQHHHDQHLSLHNKAYLRNALKLITRSLSRQFTICITVPEEVTGEPLITKHTRLWVHCCFESIIARLHGYSSIAI